MDYKVTMDEVYKLQRPFRLNKDDLVMVSHGGKTKVAKLSDFMYEITKTVYMMMLEKKLIDDEGKFIPKTEFDQYIDEVDQPES